MLKVTLFTFAVIASASGQIFDLGYCPTVPDVKLDFDKYLGRWYEIARIDNNDEKNLRCVTFDWLPSPNKSIYHEIPVIQTGYDNNNLSYVRQTSADEFTSKSAPNSFLLDDHSYYVVDVDYGNYALAFACDVQDPVPPYPWTYIPFRTRLAWILSRKPELDSEIVERLAQKLVSLDVPSRKLIYLDNKNCPIR